MKKLLLLLILGITTHVYAIDVSDFYRSDKFFTKVIADSVKSIGSNGECLTSNGTNILWGTCGAGGGISNAYASSTFPSFTYASSTYYLASNPTGFITSSALSPYVPFSYASSTFMPLASSSLFYLASNPSSYITSSALSPYMTLAYGSSTYLPLASSSLYYLATNPSGYITSSALSSYMPFSYASTTYMPLASSSLFYLATNPTGFITSSALSPYSTTVQSNALYPSFGYGTSTYSTYAYGSSTYYLASNPSSFITSSALSPYMPFSYASTTYMPLASSSLFYLASNPSSYITSSALSPYATLASPTFTGVMTSTNASSTNITLLGRLFDSNNSAGSNGECLTSTGSAIDWGACGAGGGLSGGSTGLLALWSSASSLVTSLFMDNGTVTGIGATSSLQRFNIASTTGNMMWGFGTNGQLSIATTTATTSIETGLNGVLKVSALTYAGRDVLATKIASSSSAGIQSALWDRNVVMWFPGTTNGTLLGSALSVLTNAVATNPTAVNKYTTLRRSTWSSVVTTANQQVGMRTDPMFFRSATSTNSGWFYKQTFGITYTANNRYFVGLSTCTTACLTGTTTLTNLTNTIGFGVEGATSQFVFLTNDGSGAISTTTISGLPTLATNNGYEVYMYNPPTSSVVYWRIDNLNTGAIVAEGNVTTNLPAVNTFMGAHLACSNALNTLVSACQIGQSRLYIEPEK